MDLLRKQIFKDKLLALKPDGSLLYLIKLSDPPVNWKKLVRFIRFSDGETYLEELPIGKTFSQNFSYIGILIEKIVGRIKFVTFMVENNKCKIYHESNYCSQGSFISGYINKNDNMVFFKKEFNDKLLEKIFLGIFNIHGAFNFWDRITF